MQVDQPLVDLRVGAVVGDLGVTEFTPHGARHTGHQRPRRHHDTLRHQCSGGDQRARSDASAVEDHGAHPDERVVLDLAAVQDGVVADADAGTHPAGELRVDVDGDAVLDVGAEPDLDGLGLGAQRGAVPDAGPGGERYLPDDARVGRDPAFGVQLRSTTTDGDDQRLRHGRHRMHLQFTDSPVDKIACNYTLAVNCRSSYRALS